MSDASILVTSEAFQNSAGKYADMALVKPVVITRYGRPRTVMISVEEYERLKARDRIAFDPRMLDPAAKSELLAGLLATPVSQDAADFDHEVDGGKS